VVERLMDVAAGRFGMDPAEIRRKNFIRSFPHQTPVIMNYDTGDYEASLNAALAAARYSAFAGRRNEARARGKLRGIGLCCYIEACGIAPSQAVGSLGAGVGLWESAEVRVNPVGTIEVLTGCHSHGQGHETTFAQLVAERFGVPIDQVSIVHGDTDKVQFGMGTYGSRSGAVGMSAINRALERKSFLRPWATPSTASFRAGADCRASVHKLILRLVNHFLRGMRPRRDRSRDHRR